MRRLSVAAVALLVAPACTDTVTNLGDIVPADTDSGGVEPPVPFLLATSPPRGVDILVVIDNTPAMAQEQAALATALGDLVQGLAAVNDVRVSFTTTDNGNPTCVGTSPEAGALGVSSCQARGEQFVDAMGSDDTQVGCLDACALPDFAVLPTNEGFGSQAKARPWIESIAGVPNVEVDIRSAVACAAPQGVRGCGFAQPLESMRLAVKRSMQVGEPAEGFVRPDAAFAVVVLSHAADCSHDPARQEIFSADGAQVFWSDPAAPTPGVCWNAGVQCSGGTADAWGTCVAMDKAVDGSASAASDAAMFPVSRYIELLDEVAALKAPYLSQPFVSLYVIGGVPGGYEAGVTAPSYPRNADATTLAEFGIGPACGADATGAVPLVRMRELAENNPELVTGRVASICDLDFATALAGLGDAGRPTLAPLCYPECVADLDGNSGGLQPECTVTQDFGTDDGRVTHNVPACGGVPAAPEIPQGSDVCWYPRLDRVGSTADVQDDVDPQCIEAGANMQIQIVRAGGTLEPGGTATLAWCEPDPACP